MDNEQMNAEVISVFPNKVRVSVDDLEDFQIAEDKLKVGSYLRIADNDSAVLIAVIENFSIEVGQDREGNAVRKYILEASPLGTIRDGKFEKAVEYAAKDSKPLIAFISQMPKDKRDELMKQFISMVEK